MDRLAAYDGDFFDDVAQTAEDSAREIVPIVLELTGARSVVDFGCGLGTWLAVFGEHGLDDALGIDGHHVSVDRLAIPRDRFVATDLEDGYDVARRFDLAISLEVAEHLPESSASRLVASLTSAAPTVLFSAAVPYQGGVGHVNEQWPDYWAELFAVHGFIPVDCIRARIWNNPRVAVWYAQNLLLYVQSDHVAGLAQVARELPLTRAQQLSIVHPNLFMMWRESANRQQARSPGLRSIVRALPQAVARSISKRMRLPSP